MKYLAFLLTFCATAFSAIHPPPPPPAAAGSAIPERNATPSAGPTVDNGIDVFITADFIYWTARMDGLAYVITGVGNDTTSVSKGKTKYPDWSWNPGFKGGIGLNLPHDGWTIFSEYTWLHSSGSDTTVGEDNGTLPVWNVANLNTLLESNLSTTQARGEWDIHFNMIDLSLGRNYFISRFLTLCPFTGFKVGWIDQNYRVRYALATSATDSVLQMKNDQDYWGIGLRAGLKTAWHLDPSWSIYGDFALSALWSQFEVTRIDTRNDSRNPGAGNPPLNTTIDTLNTRDDFHTIKGVLEFAIGLRGEWWFFENRYHFLIQAGWEEQLWLNNNQLLQNLFNQSSHGDLILQGLTIKLRFDF